MSEGRRARRRGGPEITMPRVTGRQRHRGNAPRITIEKYYRKNIAIPFLDHLTQEMHIRFSEEDRVGSVLFGLIPAKLEVIKSDVKAMTTKLMFWESDLPISSLLQAETD